MLRPSTSTPLALPVMLSTRRAIALGDRAKEIAKVQRDLANSEALVSQEKEVLDEGIKQLVDALSEIVNGNFRARIPFPSAQSLWPIAETLNTIYARIRSARQSKYEYQHTKNAATALIQALKVSKQNHQKLQLEQTGNPIIDAIVQELTSGQSITHPLNQERPQRYRPKSL